MLSRIIGVILIALLLSSSSAVAFQRANSATGNDTSVDRSPAVTLSSGSSINRSGCRGTDFLACIQDQLSTKVGSGLLMGSLDSASSVTLPTGSRPDVSGQGFDPFQTEQAGGFSGLGNTSHATFIEAQADNGLPPEPQRTLAIDGPAAPMSRVPEPATMTLISLGLIALAAAGLRKRLRG
jgi:hypothetical protein